MKPDLLEQLTALPPLGAALRESTPCKICCGAAEIWDIVDLNKCCSANFYQFGLAHVSVPYHRCIDCGFIFTDFFDDWTGGEFARFVYNEDYVRVDPDYASRRPKQCAAEMAAFIREPSGLKALDYGSGAGIFATKLAELTGASVSAYDPFSSPERPRDHYDLITCFEVIEHSTSPIGTLTDIGSFLGEDALAIVGTSIQPADIDQLRANWWYVAPRNGHVSIFTLEALALLGQRAGLVMRKTPIGFGYSAPGAAPDFFGSESKRIGTSILKAPNEPSEEWHGVEGRSSRHPYRWSRSDALHWRVETGVDILRLIIPFQMQFAPNFANQCTIACDGGAFPVKVQGNRMLCEASVGPYFDGRVELRTPPLRTPSENGGSSDTRYLGIALSV